MEETFFTSVGCMDGRVQDSVEKLGRQKFGAKYEDVITEPGLVGLLANEKVSDWFLSSIQKKLRISTERHNSRGIVVYGHEGCAANPISEEEHKDNVRKAVGMVKGLLDREVPTMGAYVKKVGDSWVAEEVRETILS